MKNSHTPIDINSIEAEFIDAFNRELQKFTDSVTSAKSIEEVENILHKITEVTIKANDAIETSRRMRKLRS